MTVIEICMIIIAIGEIFRCVAMILEMRMREQHLKNLDGPAKVVEQAMQTVFDSEPKAEPEPGLVMTGVKVNPANTGGRPVRSAPVFECYYRTNNMCFNPGSKAFKKKCITTDPKLCRWSELRPVDNE